MVGDTFSKIRGIYSALITPMRADESVNFDALKQIVRMQLEDGAEGFYCCGSSGEGLLLTIEERKRLVETVLGEVDGRVPVIAHVGTIRTGDAIDLARHAKSVGVDAVSMIPPYYYKFSMDEIIGYYEAVIKAVPGLSVIIYNIPQFTGVSFSKDNAGRLLDNEAVAGIKHTSSDLFGLERMRCAYPDKVYFNGFDELFLSALCAGADSAIGTTVNLYASTFKKIRDAFATGDLVVGRRLQSLTNRRVETLLKPGIFNAVKYGLAFRGVDCGSCRAPFKALGEDDKRKLDVLFAEGFGCGE